MEQKKKRILNANKYLPYFIQENDEFYVGILFDDYVKFRDAAKYNLPLEYLNERSIVPVAKGSVTKANLVGKYVRKNPEEKYDKEVHIKYIRKKDHTKVEYDRIFHVYVKELLHKYNMSINFKTNKHGQQVVVSDKLKYDNSRENTLKNTHAINLFCEVFGEFEIFTAELEPAIHFNKKFEMDLLPKGNLTDQENFDEVVRLAGRYTKNDEEHRAFQKRLHILKNYNPDIRGKGPNNFFGYIVFGFTELNIVLLENMYLGNATYVFSLNDYENNIIRDKQSVLKSKLILKRFYHYDNWENRIKAYLDREINRKR